jgi:nucleoid-associated protein YgaU
VLLTGVVVGLRHPIARAIGTEVDVNSAAPSVVAPPAAPQPVSTATQKAVAAAIAAAPTHAPRDPFQSLVGAGAEVVAPEAAAATTVTTTPSTHVNRSAHEPTSTGTVGGAAGATCAGTMHTVVSGDTLWSLAARSVKSGNTAKVTVAWHKIYRANTPPLSDPSLLPVGTKICLPAAQ